MKNHTKYTALVSTILLTSALAGPANAETPTTASLEKVPTTTTNQFAAISADPTVRLKEAEPTVVTTPAPAPVAVAAYVGPQASKIGENVAPTPVPAAPRTAPAPVKAAASAPAAPVGSGRGAALLASAYSQIGITQDCTAMVERALGSIGIITGDIAPAGFFRFGTVVGSPAPGDILISAGHVGIYAGNGQMISGGFNNMQTVLHPVSYVGAFTAVRVA